MGSSAGSYRVCPGCPQQPNLQETKTQAELLLKLQTTAAQQAQETLKGKTYCGALSNWECFIKMRAAYLAPILPWVMKEGESKRYCSRTGIPNPWQGNRIAVSRSSFDLQPSLFNQICLFWWENTLCVSKNGLKSSLYLKFRIPNCPFYSSMH